VNAAHEQNRRSWNRATRAHNAHKGDQAAFFRGGGSTLFAEERELLGELSGRTLLHLCCNSGQDTLSLARLGARATGVDISDEAIAFAQKLSADSGIAAEFERADVLDWLPRATRTFDRVFMSYGVFGWISDVGALYAGAARVLARGGRLVIVDYHPFMQILDEETGSRVVLPYGGGVHHASDGVGDYVAPDGGKGFVNPEPAHEYIWGVGDILDAIARAGLRLETLREWTHANGWKPFANMRELPGKRWAMPEGTPALPLMFGLVATKD
jgi:SAM-dependent methyltransferase